MSFLERSKPQNLENKNKDSGDLKFPLLILATAVIVLGLVLIFSGQKEIPISNRNFEKVKIDVRGQQVYLRRGCTALSMIVSKTQARSISKALVGKLGRRPGTHDLVKDALKGYDVQVLMTRIHTLKKNTYYANLYLKRGNKILKLDSRPSDGIAIALRTGAPVYVSQQLLENYGSRIC